MPDPSLLNGFATAVTRRFREAAKGLDPESSRFIKARPSERILAGFLTPLDPTSIGPSGSAVAGNEPDIPTDENYEQTHIGVEWAVPKQSIGRGIRFRVRFSMHVYARVMPTFAEASENARLRAGSTTVVEVWQRFPIGESPASPIEVELDLDRLAREGAIVEPLQAQVQSLWRAIAPADLYVWRTDLVITSADLVDTTSYRRWLSSLQQPAKPQPNDWKPSIDCRAFPSPTDPSVLRVLLRLINRSDPLVRQSEAFVDHRLYAVRLSVNAAKAAHSYSEFRSLPNSFRYDRRIGAVGINCQANCNDVADPLVIEAETLPISQTPRLMPREIIGGKPDFETLADPAKCARVLRAILREMEAYRDGPWRSKLSHLSDPTEVAEAQEAIEAFSQEIEEFARGTRLLLENPESPAAKAFRLMNLSMIRAGRGRRRPLTSWHLFQIVFIVSQIPALLDTSRESASERPLQILWFPAGGGKTEAFLGLLVWHAFLDRLRGKSFGVTAFLRYPLRLLTYQQLQRVSWVLGQAEEVRIEHSIGGEPFSLGYYVGQSTTPNSIRDAQHKQLIASDVPATWQRVFRCPACGSKDVRLRYNRDLRLVEHFCEKQGCRTAGQRLPLYIVDDDLYRYLPTVIVSTVDKLAQLGQNRRFSQLLGRIQFYCPLHGAAYLGSNNPLCAASSDAKLGRFSGVCSKVPVISGPFESVAPSLHVQDEMHLLREALATFDSHYETAAIAIQNEVSDSGGWALIGATATIAGFRDQAAHLYLRNARRFPGPGPEAYESFYYTVDPTLLGRLYVGVLGVGRTHTPAVARAIAILYRVIEKARQLSDTDLAAAQSFLGMPALSADDIRELAFLYEVILSYVLTRKGGDQVAEAVDVRVRSEVEEVSGAALRVETFNGDVEMPHMIGVMEEIESATPGQPIGERVRGVVATNVISHGVDVDRFNIMVFAGLPRQFAEYIQASARVGRQLPGIAVLVVTPQSERDRSVLDRFEKCHQYVDRLVESVPVNRWSEPALELTLPGLIAAYLMAVAARTLGVELYTVGHVQRLFGTVGAEVLDQNRVVAWVKTAVGANSPNAPQSFAEAAENLAARLYGKVTGASRDAQNENLNSFLGAMMSLRDIDDPAWIALYRDSDKELIRTLGM